MAQGEQIDQTLPTIVLSWTGSSNGPSGSFTITGTDTPWNPDTFMFVNSGGTINADGADLAPVSQSTSIVDVDTARIAKAEQPIPTAYGTATITVTPAAGTQVNYSIGIKNPHYNAKTDTALTRKFKCNVGYIYSTPIIFDPPIVSGSPATAPVVGTNWRGKGNGFNEVRFRAYETVNGAVTPVSPNDKSKIFILKFYQSA